MTSPDRNNGHGITLERKVNAATAVGIPPEYAHKLPDNVTRALEKRQNRGIQEVVKGGSIEGMSVLDRLKYDLFENVAHLGNQARVVAFMKKWGLSTGSSKEDFERAKALMIGAKENALNLEKIDTQINAQHAIQDTDSALARASGNFLARAVAPAEVRNSLSTLVAAAVVDQIGRRIFGNNYDPSDGEQIMVMAQYMEMMFKAEEGRLMIKPNVEHQRIMNTLEEAERRHEIEATNRERAAELLGKSLKAPIDYAKEVINNDVLGDSGTVVKVAEAVSSTADRLLEGGLAIVSKVVDFAKKPEIWLSSGIATAVSIGFAVGPEWLPVAAGITAGTGLVGWGLDKLKNIKVSKGSEAVSMPRVVSEQRRERREDTSNGGIRGQDLDNRGRVINANFDD